MPGVPQRRAEPGERRYIPAGGPGSGAGGSPGGWSELLPRTRLQPDTRHRFRLDGGRPVAAARLDVYPDGGMARLRLWGEADPAAHRAAAGRWLDALPPVQAAAALVAAGLPPARAHDIAAADSGRWALLSETAHATFAP